MTLDKRWIITAWSKLRFFSRSD